MSVPGQEKCSCPWVVSVKMLMAQYGVPDTTVTTTKIEEAASPALLALWHRRGEGGKAVVFYGVPFEKPLWCRVRGGVVVVG